MLVNGSACSSHARSSSCSAETTRAVGPQQLGEDRELLAGQRHVPAVPEDLPAVRVEQDAGAVSTGGGAGRARRPSAATRADSSRNANGLGR